MYECVSNLPSNPRPQSPVRSTLSSTSMPFPEFANNTHRIASFLRLADLNTKIPKKKKTFIKKYFSLTIQAIIIKHFKTLQLY